ncbi:MAG: PTS transporter subunit EIIC [Lachnospiraceae bacterium]|nr:PTS transporter subunit EIIC [Lachnospiraceae bacterium]
MSKNKDIANAIIKQIGGKDNIDSILHCMTRLRFKLKDYSNIKLPEIKGINGVLGAQIAEDSLHVIIGTTVSDVYQEAVAILGMSPQEALEENPDDPVPKKALTAKKIVTGIVNKFSEIMTPLIPLFVAMGMANVAAVLIGPSFMGLVEEGSDLYTNFYYIYQTILYFLPVFVAISAAKTFRCNTMLAVTAAAFMLLPDIITALAAETGYTVYGIPASNITYSGSVIPALLVVWALAYVERFFKKMVPNSIKVIGIPLGTLLVMFPLTLCLFGPLGDFIGTGLTAIMLKLYSIAGPVETTLIGALTIFLTAFGIGRPLFFACMSTLFAAGVDYAYMPYAMVVGNFIAMGISAGYLVKEKRGSAKEVGMTSLLAAVLGGVSEPTIFGIILPNKKTYIPAIVSGAVAGLIGGLMNVGYYQFGPSNIIGVVGFLSAENSSNFIFGCVMSAAAAIIAFVCMLIFYKEDKG